MSTLQLSLLVIGALVVLAVYLFNVLQERRVRRRMQAKAAGGAAAKRGAETHARIEPSLRVPRAVVKSEPVVLGEGSRAVALPGQSGADGQPAMAVQVAQTDAAAGTIASATSVAEESSRTDIEPPDPDTELVVVFKLRAPTGADQLVPDTRGEFGKAVRWFSRRARDSAWTPLREGQASIVGEIASCLMLVDRDGPVSSAQLQTFLRMVADRAEALHAQIEMPRVEDVLERAKTLDRICAEVDVQIGINVVKPEGAASATIPGTRLRGVAEAAGFRLGGRGQFEYWHEEHAVPLFSLQTQRGEPLSAESLRSLQAGGLTLLLDVPRTPDAAKAFDQMRAIAKRLATTLEAILVDDKRKPLSDAALGTIRSQVHETVAAMRANHIEPGSPRALRLFD